jgi:sulfopyruvate decarboxylase subunit beta
VRYPEKELINILKNGGVDFVTSLPCEKIKLLLEMLSESFFHVPLTREEEGVGISAGAALTGKRPAMFVQSSGIGNMINALLSLTEFYKLPLSIFISHRGIYKEKIAAQVPMGKRLAKVLQSAGIPYSIIRKREDFSIIEKLLSRLYDRNKIHAFLMSPSIWDTSDPGRQRREIRIRTIQYRMKKPVPAAKKQRSSPSRLSRFQILQTIAPDIISKAVICNLGWPAKELFYVSHRPSNFYMLGSMGMASPIGLGISLTSEKEVLVIDGDGSLLMNPGILATAAHYAPRNLTILTIDNSSFGSTGDQPTLTGSCVDLEAIARGFGIKNTVKVSKKRQISHAMKKGHTELQFIHALARAGNQDVPNISLDHLKNKKQFQRFLESDSS